MWVRKDKAGACSGPDGGYTWENDGDVVEVADHIGEELLALPGFSEADAPKKAPKQDAGQGGGDGGQDDGAGSSGDGEGDSSGEASKPSARRGRPRKTVEE